MRLVSRLTQLQGVFEEIEAKQRELAQNGGGAMEHGKADAYFRAALSLKQILNGEKSVFHLSAEAEYLYSDPDPEPREDIEQGLKEGLGQGDEYEHNPGSLEAVKQGCLCAVFDNAHGRGYGGTSGKNAKFVKTGSCPFHGKHTWPLLGEAQR